MTIFQRLYDLEINFAVSCFWDGGFDVKLGDPMNGWRAETEVRTWPEVEEWLRVNAAIHWPIAAMYLKEPIVDLALASAMVRT